MHHPWDGPRAGVQLTNKSLHQGEAPQNRENENAMLWPKKKKKNLSQLQEGWHLNNHKILHWKNWVGWGGGNLEFITEICATEPFLKHRQINIWGFPCIRWTGTIATVFMFAAYHAVARLNKMRLTFWRKIYSVAEKSPIYLSVDVFAQTERQWSHFKLILNASYEMPLLFFLHEIIKFSCCVFAQHCLLSAFL